ncbi:hypothetical protein H8356DRAFT_1416903 [Neocallimastix lanati (nom. inval.)]|jgi:hypothetical protein|nr:hypothetical protein H8356DRAFT_1416903 [Neocallimastix sp. JGI-2020a]
MKFQTYLFASVFSIGFAKAADFFKGVKRAEIFRLTEFNMPTIRINLSKESYDRFQLTYKCLYDNSPLIENDNEDCYKAPWVNYTDIMSALVSRKYIDTKKLKGKQLELVNSPELGYDDFKSIINIASSIPMNQIFSQKHSFSPIPSFEEKNASLDFILNKKTTTKDSIKLSIGGKYTKIFEKQQYNIKINNGDLFGRQQLRLRSEVVDPSFLRSKIGYDLCNILGLPSLQASYTLVYINDDNMGLYLLRDAYKPQWVEANYGIANTTSLYKCDKSYGSSDYFNCQNDETEVVDEDFTNFINKMEKAKDTRELSKFFDTDLYIKWQAFKYLTGSWDHITNYHNQYLFNNNGKWINLLYDFDSDFGAYRAPNPSLSFVSESVEMDYPLYKTLGLSNTHKELVNNIKKFVINGFNPVKLFPRIDELMKYLYPYILEDRTPEKETTERPGHFVRPDYKIENGFTVTDHVKNAEFHNYVLKKYSNNKSYSTDEIYGLKRWIIERFRYACTKYNIDCSFAKDYLEGGKFSLPSLESTKVEMEEHLGGCNNTGYHCCSDPNTTVYTSDSSGDWGVEGDYWCLIVKEEQKPSEKEEECWSLERGYPCCVYATTVYYTSSNGKTWSVENGDWCGII